MTDNDEHLAHYLADFQPRPLRSLLIPTPAQNPWLRRVAAAAALSLCLGAGYWQLNRYRLSIRVIQLKSQTQLLTRIGLSDPRKLDALLDNQSPNVLPDLQGERSTLRVLAKE